ncbi:hypothetical protein CI610_02508 [invertebrate metagenome]|uniref:Uncharacterized protein n=1 Tax=invertebrate metagenome TaxID=1711999 RepID=A0A2H9T5S4_9ZZZZ
MRSLHILNCDFTILTRRRTFTVTFFFYKYSISPIMPNIRVKHEFDSLIIPLRLRSPYLTPKGVKDFINLV